MLCLVSGGADSTCLFHALRELDYRRRALHVDHGLRGAESDGDAAWCAEQFDAEVVQAAARCATEAALRDVRYSFRTDVLRATGHTRSDQVETILYRLAARGTTKGIEVRRADGVVRPLLCSGARRPRRSAASAGSSGGPTPPTPTTLRGLIRNEILPLLVPDPSGGARERAARARRAADDAARARRAARHRPRARSESTSETGCRSSANTSGSGSSRARAISTEPSSGAPGGSSRACRGLRCEAGGRATGSSAAPKKVQDVFVDAKIPRSDREGWPLVVRGDEVVAVPGIVEAEGVIATRVAD